jgi:hypothetical protein
MDDIELPESLPPHIFGYKPDQLFDRDLGAQKLGFNDETDLLASGTELDAANLDSYNESFQKNNDQISAWLQNHVKTAEAVIMLTDRLKSLEDRFSEQSARLRAVEAQLGLQA